MLCPKRRTSDFEPLIRGEPRMTEDGRGSDRPPTQEDIDSLELQQMALEDTKRQLESALKSLAAARPISHSRRVEGGFWEMRGE
jgi:hypothetical protein